MDLSAGRWLHQPRTFDVSDRAVSITTEPHTDFWQRTYYGFRNDKAPALLFEHNTNFTFTTRASFSYRGRFDQCGVLLHVDSENWCKIAVEAETEKLARLGSVVTNNGHSDWATSDIAPVAQMWFRVSQRGPDFLIESSSDGLQFAQMRIFHLHTLGTTSATIGKQDPPEAPQHAVRFGVFACSPMDASFVATFDHCQLTDSQWPAHQG